MKFIFRKAIPAATALIVILSTVLVTMPVQTAEAAEGACPDPSTSLTFADGTMNKFDSDSPVRPTPNNPDKNLTYRELVNGKFTDSLFGNGLTFTGLRAYTRTDSTPPPQIATLFNPARTPVFTFNYQFHKWTFATSPKPGTRGNLIVYNPPATQSRGIGMTTTPGEALRAPCHGYDLGSPWGIGGYAVLYADSNSITLVATRKDSVARGYVLHILGVNVDSTLLSHYNTDDNPNGDRYNSSSFNLPGLKAGQVFGRAAGTEIIVSLRDNGAFMDTGDSTNWWVIRSWIDSPEPGPSLMNPSNGATIASQTPSFIWGPVSHATAYELQISTSPTSFSGAEDHVFDNATLRYDHTAASLAQGTYYWRVSGGRPALPWSAVSSFTIDVRPRKPTPLTPTGTISSTTPTFTWTGSSTVDHYTLRVTGPGTHPDATGITPAAAGCDADTSCSITSPWTLPANGNFTFTVEGISDTLGTRGPSGAMAFTIDNTPPTVPKIVSPTGGKNIATPSVTLQTKVSTGAAKYQFELELLNAGLTGTSNGNNNGPKKTYSLGTNFGKYIWAARAQDAAGNLSAWSAPARFNYTLMSGPANALKFAKTAKITLKWLSFGSGATYEVAYSTTSDPTDDCGNTDTCVSRGTNKSLILSGLAPGTYFWSVRVNGVGNWMLPWTFIVKP